MVRRNTLGAATIPKKRSVTPLDFQPAKVGKSVHPIRRGAGKAEGHNFFRASRKEELSLISSSPS
jgi:hypothetical protein